MRGHQSTGRAQAVTRPSRTTSVNKLCANVWIHEVNRAQSRWALARTTVAIATLSATSVRARTNVTARMTEVQATSAQYPTVEDLVGNTPLVRMQRLGTHLGKNNTILLKLEGDNPAGSVKDRPALSMITRAERAGRIKPGDTLIEATSGNTGIALAMAAATKGYKLRLIMPSNMSEERRASMRAYGAELMLVAPGAMEAARDMAQQLQAAGEGIVLDQFGNPDNPEAHHSGTGPELWEQTGGRITHFVSSMGTTGTIMGASRFLKGKNPDVQIVGLQPASESSIPGIRRWPPAYLPTIFDASRVDRVIDITQREAEECMRALARVEGIMAGVSSGGAVSAALRLASEVENATICAIICDRGDRYLSTGVYNEAAMLRDPQPCPVKEWPSAEARLEVAYPGPHYVVFTADPVDGVPWCGDCARALPAIRAVVQDVGGTLLEVEVGEKAAWKDPGHVFRHAAGLKLTCIPTLMRWSDHGWTSRLDTELENAKTIEEVDSLVRKFCK